MATVLSGHGGTGVRSEGTHNFNLEFGNFVMEWKEKISGRDVGFLGGGMMLGYFRSIFIVVSFFLLGFTAQESFGRTLIITDIDDTLKIAHVRDSINRIFYATRTDCAFVGMAELLSSLARKPGVDVVYLSNAPDWLMGRSHREFLEKNNFPLGPLHLRGFSTSSEAHKPEFLRKVAESGIYDKLILLGDNGERDPLAFQDIQRLYPELSITGYIHAIYRDNLHNVGYQPKLIPFVSAYDLAMNMNLPLEADFIGDMVYQALVSDLKDEYQASQVAPAWIYCHPEVDSFLSGLTWEWRLILGAGCERGI